MFPSGYFTGPYYAGRYFPHVDSDAAPPAPAPVIICEVDFGQTRVQSYDFKVSRAQAVDFGE